MTQTTGIIIERDLKGKPVFAHIDLRKYGEILSDFFTSQGVEIEQSPYGKKFTAKIMKSKAEYERGEYTVIDPDNFWDKRSNCI
jgi:hypothetical protein